jgi:hypothetical protein
MLYGSGDYDVKYHVVQGSWDTLPSDVVSGVRPAPTAARAEAIAMGGGAAAAAAAEAAAAIAGVSVQRVVENVGDLTIAHESWNGMKYPPGVQRGNEQTTPKQIPLAGPRYDAYGFDTIFCDLIVDFEYDGRGVGKVATRAGKRSDAVGKGLVVNMHIVDDARTFTGGTGGTSQTFAGIRITLEYSFTQVIADDIVVHAEVMLYGNGDYDIAYHLIQGEVDTMPPNVASGVHATTASAVPQSLGEGGGGKEALIEAGVEAAKRIGGFFVDRLLDDSDNIESSLDQWPKDSDRSGPAPKKYPWDDASRGGRGATQHKTLTIGGPETDLHWVDDMFCELVFSWDYNGHWLTNVGVEKGRRNGPATGKLHVTAHLDDVPGASAHIGSPQEAFGALRYRVSWEYHRSLHADIVVHADVLLYGDGSWRVSYDVLQGNVDAIRQNVFDLMGGADIIPISQPATQSLGTNGASPVTHSSETRGSVRFELDQYTGMKQPSGVAPTGTPTQTATVRVGGPHASMATGGDESFGDCEISYDFDGRALGNVHVRPTATGGTAPLVVAESITDDTQVYAMPGSQDPLAALRLRFEYRFDSTRPLKTDVTLYGNGRQDIYYDWSQV